MKLEYTGHLEKRTQQIERFKRPIGRKYRFIDNLILKKITVALCGNFETLVFCLCVMYPKII